MLAKLASRKLLATLITAVLNIVVPVVAAPLAPIVLPPINKLVMVYVGAEGLADTAGAFSGS